MRDNSAVNRRRPLEQLTLVMALCVGLGLAHVGTSTMPFQVGALIQATGRSPAEAGLFGFFQVGALALGMIAISSWIDQVHPRIVAMGSGLLAAVASALLYFSDPFALQLLFGTLAGFAFGLTFAATIAAASASPEPDRTYGIGNGGALVMIVGVVALSPALDPYLGTKGIFMGIAALSLLSVPFFFGFRKVTTILEAREAPWRREGAAGLLFSWAACSLGTTAVYAFSERVGASIGLDPQTIGWCLSGGIVVGIAGTVTAAIVGPHMNRRAALLLGLVGCGASCLLLSYAGSLTAYAAGVFIYWICYMFLYSMLMGTAALLDPSGRLGTLGGGLERTGYAVGAWSGGLVAEHFNFAATGAFGCIACVIGLLLGYPSLFRALSRR